MKKIYNAAHFDFHTLPGIYDFGSNFDAEKFAKDLYESHVKYINVAAQCNSGLCYFDTKAGIRYEGMQGDRLKEIIEACHKLDIGVSCYMNLGICQSQAIKHPDWVIRNQEQDKKHEVAEGAKEDLIPFKQMCLNTGYFDYVLAITKELTEYDVDGFFFDGMDVKLCFCENCLKELKAKNINIDDTIELYNFYYQKNLSLCNKIKEIIGGNKNIFFNNMPEQSKVNTHYELEWIPQSWGYEVIPVRMALGRANYDRLVYMTGRFQLDWGDFGGVKPIDSILNDYYDAVMNGYEFCIGDHLHPANGIDKKVLRSFRYVNDFADMLTPYIKDVRYNADIAIITNKKPLLCWWDRGLLGAARMLSELKISFNIEYADNDYRNYKLIILPDEITLDEREAERLKKYIESGGKVISSNVSAMTKDCKKFALLEYDFINYDGKRISEGYTIYKDIADDEIYSNYYDGISMTLNDGEVLAKYCNPYFNTKETKGYVVNYNPPDKETSEVIAAKRGYIVHIAYSIFASYSKYFMAEQKEFVYRIITSLCNDLTIRKTDLPSYTRVGVLKGKDFDMLMVKSIYPEIKDLRGVIEDSVYLHKGYKIEVRGHYKRVEVALTNKILKTSHKDGYTEIILNEIKDFEAIMLAK